MNKKGSMSALVTIIIFCVIAISLLSLTGKLTLFGKETAGVQSCRKCIELGNSNNIIDVNCECFGEELLIRYKDVVEGGKINQNKAHQIIANAMYDTLYKYHGGDLDPAPDYKKITEEGICRAGYYIKFDSKLRNFMYDNLKESLEKATTPEQRAEEYKKYGITNPLPFLLREAKTRGGGMSYYEYLTKEQNPENAESFGTETLLNTGTLMEYSTIQLRYIRDDDSDPTVWAIAGGIGLGIAGTAIGIATAGTGFVIIGAIVGAGVGGAVGAGAGALGSEVAYSLTEWVEETSNGDTRDFSSFDTYMVAFPDKNTFKSCQKCKKASGGVLLLPPNFNYQAEWMVKLDEDKYEKWPVCSVLIG